MQDQVGEAELLGEASGFSPLSLHNSFEGKNSIVQHDRALQARRSTLIEQFAMAGMSCDEGGKADARVDIAKFNEKNPARRTQPLQLARWPWRAGGPRSVSRSKRSRLPVPVECREPARERPSMPIEALAEGADPFDLLRASLAEIDRCKGYEVKLVAALENCKHPLISPQ